jgi:hypothetical protein
VEDIVSFVINNVPCVYHGYVAVEKILNPFDGYLLRKLAHLP